MLIYFYRWFVKQFKKLYDIFVVFSSKAFTAFTVMLLMIIIARSFGTVGSGVLSMILLVPGLAFSFGNLGVDNSNIYFLANKQSNPKKILSNTIIQSLVMSALMVVIFLLFFFVYPGIIGELNPIYFYISLLIVPIFFIERFLQSILIGLQDFNLFGKPLIVTKTIILLLVAFSIFVLNSSLFVATLLFAVSLSILPFWYLFVLIKKYGFSFEFDLDLFKRNFLFSLKSYIIALFCFLILRADIYILNIYRGVSEVGIYSVATNFFDAINLITASIALVLFPQMSSNIKDGYKILRSGLKLTSIFVIPAILVVAIFAKPLILLIFGPSFISAIYPFVFLSIALVFWSLTVIINQYFSSIGIPFYLMFVWLLGLALNIILNIMYIPKYGMLAASISSLIAYFVLFVLSYILSFFASKKQH